MEVAGMKEEDGYELVHESLSSQVRVYRLRRPNCSDMAIKVLPGKNPDPEQLKGLYDEYILSRNPLLSRCDAVRAALRRTTINGMHAIYLEWAEGVTLMEWIRSNRSATNVEVSFRSAKGRPADLVPTMRLACVIAGALADMHSAGVVHNSITSDHIIVDMRSCGPYETNVSLAEKRHSTNIAVKFIDLKSASLVRENDPSISLLARRRDLSSLGRVLRDMFPQSQHGNHQSTTDRLQSMNVAVEEVAVPSLSLYIVPRHVSALISNLLGTQDAEATDFQYLSAREVQEDLQQMIDFPEHFLDDGDEEDCMGMLDFPGDRLYGRDEESSVLYDAFSRVATPGCRSEVVLVAGLSGTGKTSLVHHIQSPVRKQGGIFLSQKFDLLQHAEDVSPLLLAFSEYCEKVFEGGGDTLQKMRSDLQSKVGDDGVSVLMDFLPGLQKLMGEQDVAMAMDVGRKEAQNRLNYMLRLFVRALASKSNPFVLFLDDLQWCDAASLDLIMSLVTDEESDSLLFIGCYRDNEVNPLHPLSMLFSEVEQVGVPVTSIKIDHISKTAMNELISDTLHMLRSQTKGLADIVYDKTGGNPFFAIQFLKHLWDLDLLRFPSRSWQWDITKAQLVNFAESSLELMTGKIRKLPNDVRKALEVAASLGYHSCDEGTLRLISVEDVRMKNGNSRRHDSWLPASFLAEMLDVAVTQGLMDKTRSGYEFAHDQIQHAVYSSMPEDKRSALHRHIGKCIWKNAPPEKLDQVLFVAVDQLYQGTAPVDEADRPELARLFLRAGRKAMTLLQYMHASNYLHAGIDMLGPGHWADQYDLALQLHLSCAESDYCNGCDVNQTLNQVLSNARCFEDKLGAYATLVDALAAKDKVHDAIRTCCLVLELLGEPFPVTESLDLKAFITEQNSVTRSMLEGYTIESLATMKPMTDSHKIAAMEFLKSLNLYIRLGEARSYHVVTLAMVQLTVSYGICKESSIAFAMYGALSCEFGDVTRGYEFGQLALRLVERFESADCFIRVSTIVYGLINHWSLHIHRSLDRILNTYRFGLRCGDIVMSVTIALVYFAYSFQSGKPLAQLEGELRTICQKMREYKQETILAATLIIRQTVLKLMGHSDDPLGVMGSTTEKDQTEHGLDSATVSYFPCKIYFFRMLLAYTYSNYELAADMADRSRNISLLASGEFDESTHAFYDGLISLALFSKTRQEKWVILARKALEKMRIWASSAPNNFQHKVALLEAEFAILEDYGNAATAKLYDKAINVASESGFIQDQALASERAARFYYECGDISTASEYYDQAHDLYVEWGALGKAEHLRQQTVSLLLDDSN